MSKVDTFRDFLQNCKDSYVAEGIPATGPADADPTHLLCVSNAEAVQEIEWQLARLGMITVGPGVYPAYKNQVTVLRAMKVNLLRVGNDAWGMSDQFKAMVKVQAEDAS